jgi:hypothetical protein
METVTLGVHPLARLSNCGLVLLLSRYFFAVFILYGKLAIILIDTTENFILLNLSHVNLTEISSIANRQIIVLRRKTLL